MRLTTFVNRTADSADDTMDLLEDPPVNLLNLSADDFLIAHHVVCLMILVNLECRCWMTVTADS